MTNISCLNHCQYQIEGKCCCDSVMMPYLGDDPVGGPDCPYQTMPKSESIQKDLPQI